MNARQDWPTLLSILIRGEALSADDTAWAMDQIMEGEATAAQVAGFAVALRAKGETVAEVTGLARAMLDHAALVSVPGPTVDIVGTGGDRAHTVNISTMAAIVAAAAGVTVVKHGNRAASSSCGSADLLEQLGVDIDLDPKRTVEVAERVGITFCFASLFHPALRHAAGPRGELGVPTVFNFLGPLTNPARPSAQAVGVYDPAMCEVVAGVLAGRGVSALAFRGDDGLDEMTTTTTSSVWTVRDGSVVRSTLDPLDLGIPRAAPEQLRGADPAYNRRVARAVLAGERGPVRDAVVLNAAAGLVAGSTGEHWGEPLARSLAEAAARAVEAIDSGAAAALLERWVTATGTP
ncbi:MAG: anthranilate phosphoribosyltransferase [Streptosporangiaceae bacterium]